MRDVDEV